MTPKELPRWRTARVASQGEDVYYEVTGEDDLPTVVLTHGAGGSHASWFQQVPALAAAGYRVVTWDTRGFGNTTFRTGAFGANHAVSDLVAVLDAADVDHAHLVGQSMGGWWVTAFALEYPSRVRSLALCNTVGGLWTDALSEHFATWAREEGSTFAEPRLGAHRAVGSALVHRDPAHAFLYQQLNTFHAPPMVEVGAALVVTRFEHAAIDALDIPVLVVSGTDDPIFPAALVAKSAALLTRAEFVEIPGAGHSPYFEDPAAFNAALLDFLARTPKR